MKLSIAALFLFLVGFIPHPDTPSFDESESKEEKIHWEENRKLTWADFKGVPNEIDQYVASTNSGVSFSFSYKERNGVTTINIEVKSNFYPELSWYRPASVSPYILAHEQLHFDISELHARKLRKQLSTIPKNREYKEKAEKLYEQMETERRDMQHQYDNDSDHSNHEENEYQWRAYVAQQLAEYDSWK